MRWSILVTVAATGLLLTIAAQGAPSSPVSPASDRADSITTIMDELRRQRAIDLALLRDTLAADEAKERGADIVLTLPDFLDYNPALLVPKLRPATITVRLARRGGKWQGAWATGWTESEHKVDPSSLTWADGRLGGTMRIVFDPRGERTQGIFGRPLNYDQIPTQAAPFPLEIAVDLRGAGDGKLAGTYRRAAQEGFGEVDGDATATVRGVPSELLPELPSSGKPDAALASMWRQIAGLEWMRLGHGWWDEIAAHLPEFIPSARDGAGLAALTDLAVRARRALADRAARPVPDHGVGPGGCDDPDFGAWLADAPLETAPEADGRLPADLAAQGPQEWRYIGRWHVVLGLPGGLDLRRRAGTLAPMLADRRLAVRTADGAEHAWRQVGIPTGFGQHRSPRIRVMPPWIDPLLEPKSTPRDEPDAQTRPQRPAAVSFLATADVESPKACTLWLGTGMFVHNATQRLYLNERLIWESARVDEPTNIRGAVMKVTLRPGMNRLLLHGATSRYNGTLNPFLVALCTRGAPRSRAQVEADQARQRAAIAATERTRSHLRGHMTDWRGQHPEAQPVRAWNVESNINIVWRRELPEGTDSASLLLVGRKLLTTGWPHVLTCLDADTGKVLWRRIASRFELLDPALVDEAERLRLAAEEARAGLNADPPDDQKAQLRATIAKWQAMLDRLDDKLGRRKATWDFPWFHSPDWAAPVSDGNLVWVKFGTGVAACYDLEGNRKWMVATGNPIVGERCSPVLVDGLLVLMLPRRYDPSSKYVADNIYTNAGTPQLIEGDLRNYELLALDAATGKERWRTPVWAGGNEGSPVVAQAAAGDDAMSVIVTPGGTVVRPSDGKVLSERSGIESEPYQTPCFEGDCLFFTTHYSSVVSARLVMRSRDRVALAPNWLSPNNGLTQMQQCGVYTIAHRGRICVMNPRLGVSSNLGPHEACFMDLATGVAQHRLSFVYYDGGHSYTPHVAAKDVLLLNQYQGTSTHETPYLNMAIVSMDRQPRVLARNGIPLTKAAPVCDRDRIYIRGERQVVCLGRVGDQGAAYERRILARHLLSQTIPPRPEPPESKPLAIAPDPAPVGEGVPIWPVATVAAPGRWLFAGPFLGDDPPVADPGAARLAPGQTLAGQKVQRKVVELDAKLVGAKQGDYYYRGNTGYAETNAIDVRGTAGSEAGTVAYFYTVLRIVRPCAVHIDVDAAPQTQSWVGGQRTEKGRAYSLSPGRYPWLIVFRVPPLPPMGQPIIKASLRHVPDPSRELAAWRQTVAAYRQELLGIVADDPGTEQAAEAQSLLQQIGDAKQP